MNKQVVDSTDLLIAKVNDKVRLSKSKNQIMYTDFLNEQEMRKVEKYLIQNNISGYTFFGGYDNAIRKALITYPEEKLEKEMVESNYNKIFSCIRIKLNSELVGKYEHRDYLSGIMKLGIEREKIGDIIVLDDLADIIVFKENLEYLIANLRLLTRFKKCEISEIPLEEITVKDAKFDDISIIVNSMRIDNFVSELAHTSRNRAAEFIEFGRVLLNYEEVFKSSKQVQEGDVITIRGKGKFIIGSIERQTRSGKNVVKVKKYV